MSRLVLLACTVSLYCAGAAHKEPANLGRQLITVSQPEGLPGCEIAYNYPVDSWAQIIAVAVCHQEKPFASSAAQAAVRSVSANPGISVAELWDKVKVFLQDAPSRNDLDPIFIATFFFYQEANWSFLYGNGPIKNVVMRGQMVFPSEGRTVFFSKQFNRTLFLRLQTIEKDSKSFSVTIDHEIFGALDKQNSDKGTWCSIL